MPALSRLQNRKRLGNNYPIPAKQQLPYSAPAPQSDKWLESIVFYTHQVVRRCLTPLLGWCQRRLRRERGLSYPPGGNKEPLLLPLKTVDAVWGAHVTGWVSRNPVGSLNFTPPRAMTDAQCQRLMAQSSTLVSSLKQLAVCWTQ